MHIKSIVAATAIALAATVGSAYAAETFDTMRGVPAEEATFLPVIGCTCDDRLRGQARG